MNKSINYLSANEELDINEFANEVIDEPNMRSEFFNYKSKFESDQKTELKDSFPIAQNSVKSKKRSIKNLIKLDTNIQIKLDNQDPETNKQYIEKGYDKVRGMNYYKIFYNSENE